MSRHAQTRKITPTYTVGIDEVGRGPIAGPVAVGAFVFLDAAAKRAFRGVKDSKQLTAKKREEWLSVIQVAKKKGVVDFQVVFRSESVIDGKGLSFAIRDAVDAALKAVVKRNGLHVDRVKVLLDGGLKAPPRFEDQKTIVRGDEKEMVIALASICAKVLRDRRMSMLAKRHPEYGFERHKGYGTREHYLSIQRHGRLSCHRRSFLRADPLGKSS